MATNAGNTNSNSRACRPVVCTIKPPVHISLADHKLDFHSGCLVMDVTFPNTFYVQVGEINFRNFYTAQLTVKAKCREQSSNTVLTEESRWQTCVKRMQLMPDPHCQQNSEEYFTIGPKQLKIPLQNITALRFILYQPSTVWKTFSLEDIKLFKVAARVPREVPLPAWMADPSKLLSEEPEKQLKGVPAVSSLSHGLQKLWASTAQLSTTQPTASLSRYDVDGCYEINLLSYT